MIILSGVVSVSSEFKFESLTQKFNKLFPDCAPVDEATKAKAISMYDSVLMVTQAEGRPLNLEESLITQQLLRIIREL